VSAWTYVLAALAVLVVVNIVIVLLLARTASRPENDETNGETR
jgi:hypothetical protein